jgi:UDP-2,3-diacylglucosamine pyrophosphatase LpxH
MEDRAGWSRTRLRSVFVSDVHLGCRYSQAEPLLAFLQAIQPEYLYLVGDIIDGWRLARNWHWRPEFSRILARLLELGRSGTQLRFTPGNHDAFLREFADDFGFVEVADSFVHKAADGRQFLVLHGDRFDDIELQAQWLSYFGAWAYDALLWFNAQVNACRRVFRLEPRQYSTRIKQRVKQAVTFVSRFEQRLARAARDADCDGVVCGHVHTPASTHHDGLAYFNPGDWVEHRSALVERAGGHLELVHLPQCPWAIAEAISGLAPGRLVNPDSNSRVPLGKGALPAAAGVC